MLSKESSFVNGDEHPDRPNSQPFMECCHARDALFFVLCKHNNLLLASSSAKVLALFPCSHSDIQFTLVTYESRVVM